MTVVYAVAMVYFVFVLVRVGAVMVTRLAVLTPLKTVTGGGVLVVDTVAIAITASAGLQA